MEATRTNPTNGVHKTNCCASSPATSPQEKSAKNPNKDSSKHVAPTDAAANCCCGGTQKAET
jgi:hypothetical protein